MVTDWALTSKDIYIYEGFGKTRQILYPAGEELRFDFADEVLAVYSGEVTLLGEIAPQEHNLVLRYQACDDRRCLPPVEKPVPVEDER